MLTRLRKLLGLHRPGREACMCRGDCRCPRCRRINDVVAERMVNEFHARVGLGEPIPLTRADAGAIDLESAVKCLSNAEVSRILREAVAASGVNPASVLPMNAAAVQVLEADAEVLRLRDEVRALRKAIGEAVLILSASENPGVVGVCDRLAAAVRSDESTPSA
jgi:hypothetical protein